MFETYAVMVGVKKMIFILHHIIVPHISDFATVYVWLLKYECALVKEKSQIKEIF